MCHRPREIELTVRTHTGDVSTHQPHQLKVETNQPAGPVEAVQPGGLGIRLSYGANRCSTYSGVINMPVVAVRGMCDDGIRFERCDMPGDSGGDIVNVSVRQSQT